ncbi:RTA1-like protein [Marasmius fiardii PR-910]|nr:RTA1-like protein [Marasmius fiardii PR-910]
MSPRPPIGICCVLLALVATIASVSTVQASNPSVPQPDPFADPKYDVYNPLRYIASNVLTAVAFFLAVALLQTLCMVKWGAKYMLAMTIGAYTFAFGISTRFGLHLHPQSKGLYIVQYLFVVLSPCAFIAAVYILLGRLTRHLDCDKHLLVSPRKITMVFVSSDVITFLVQAAGGGTTTANDPDLILIGSRLFLVGLALQLGSFVLFSVIYLVFLYRVRLHEFEIWQMDGSQKWHNDWRALAAALLVRSVYRTVELSEGFGGHLSTTESYFYLLDTLPLFIAIVVYLPFWPGRFITSETTKKEQESSLPNPSE